jgi:multiple antibiotic resistance protein
MTINAIGLNLTGITFTGPCKTTSHLVMMRLMGLIVMVIAVEFFFSGLKPIILDIMNQAAR